MFPRLLRVKLFVVQTLQQHSEMLPLMETERLHHIQEFGDATRHVHPPNAFVRQSFLRSELWWSAGGYLGQRVSVCKRSKAGEKRGDLKAQHFFGLEEKTMG